MQKRNFRSVYIDHTQFPLFSKDYSVKPNVSSSCCEVLYAAQAGGSILGNLGVKGSNYEHTTSMALVKNNGWTSVWSETVNLPGSAFRDIAKFSGVNIYSDTDDTFYENSSYVSLTAKTAGQKTIHFPRKVTLYDASTNTVLITNSDTYTYNANKGDVFIGYYY
jgi:hypothetical protein